MAQCCSVSPLPCLNVAVWTEGSSISVPCSVILLSSHQYYSDSNVNQERKICLSFTSCRVHSPKVIQIVSLQRELKKV
jgi:hypothetical protein